MTHYKPQNTEGRYMEDIAKALVAWYTFEDINHSVDGGIYAELVQNRSFEEFTYDTYDARSGDNADQPRLL